MCVRCRQRARLAGQVAPSAHQPRAVHVNQRVRDVEVFRHELPEERLVRLAEALMQIVDVAVARVPAARRQIGQPFEPDRRRLHAARRHVHRHRLRHELPAANRLDRRLAGRHFHFGIRRHVEVVPVEHHHRPVERVVRRVVTAVARVDVDARADRLAVGPDDANAHAAGRRDDCGAW